MATAQPSVEAGVYKLPITGRRNGRNGVVVGFATVLDDEFTTANLSVFNWCLDGRGYACRRIAKKTVYLHQIVFENYFGPVPTGMHIDHEDRDRVNNLPSNLRAVTSRINRANQLRKNATGFQGVNFRGNRNNPCWEARIMVFGKSMFLGSFAEARAAANAVNEAYRKYYPEVQIPNPLS